MRLRALAWLRCPMCRGPLAPERLRWREAARELPGWAEPCDGRCGTLEVAGRPCEGTTCAALEVEAGELACRACRLQYDIEEGVPKLLEAAPLSAVTRRTAASFGFLWARSAAPTPGRELSLYHVERMASSVGVELPQGLVLDAGCGEGIDLVNQVRRPGVEMVGVELSRGGCRTSLWRSQGRWNTHIVQADLARLPFDDHQFDFVYSYGVLHHLAAPEAGAAELLRVLKPGGRCLIYLYEDFGERPRALRWLLAAVNGGRALTTRLPASWLFLCCQAAAPVIFLCCVVPYRLLRRARRWRGVAEQIPFRHASGPWGLAGDLYDRFSAPVERRYSRQGAAALLQASGADEVTVAYERGWVATGVKPARVVACAG